MQKSEKAFNVLKNQENECTKKKISKIMKKKLKNLTKRLEIWTRKLYIYGTTSLDEMFFGKLSEREGRKARGVNLEIPGCQPVAISILSYFNSGIHL